MLGCAAARALAASLLELRSSGFVDGPTPLPHEVEGDHRYSGLDLSCAFCFGRCGRLFLTGQTIFLPFCVEKKNQSRATIWRTN